MPPADASSQRCSAGGDLTVACKLGVFVRTPVFCLCWAYITGPFQKDSESEAKAFESLCGSVVKTEFSTGLMGLWELCVRLLQLYQQGLKRTRK